MVAGAILVYCKHLCEIQSRFLFIYELIDGELEDHPFYKCYQPVNTDGDSIFLLFERDSNHFRRLVDVKKTPPPPPAVTSFQSGNRTWTYSADASTANIRMYYPESDQNK